MTNCIGIKETSKRLGKSKRQAQRMCATGKLPGARKVNGQWQVPVTADARLIDRTRCEKRIGKELAGFSAKKVKEAKRKLGLIIESESYVAGYVRNGGGRSDALSVFAADNGISTSSLKRWNQQYKKYDMAGLVDMRGGNRFADETISEGALDYFLSLYLSEKRRSVSRCLMKVKAKNIMDKNGWMVPSTRVMQYYAKNNIPEPVKILHREGLNAYVNKVEPYIEVDPESIEPGEIWVGDHHQFNCWVRYRGRLIRPWITAWEDMRSRALAGWYINPAPNQTTILIATRRAIEKYGAPMRVKIDNGKDYDSEMWTGSTKAERKKRRVLNAGYLDEAEVAGIYGWLDIKVSFAIPYNAKAKRIERLFETIDSGFTIDMNTYCGKDSPRKPEYLNKMLSDPKFIESIISIEEFAEKFTKYAESYNNSSHTGEGMDGKSPAEVIAARSWRREIDRDSLDAALCVWSRELKVGKNGVRLNNVRYGQYSEVLLANWGKKVRLAYNPDDTSYVMVYETKTMKPLCIAENNKQVSYNQQLDDRSIRNANRKKLVARKYAREYHKAARTANMDTVDIAIESMKQTQRPKAEQPTRQNIRPVKTPFEKHAAERGWIIRQHKARKLKRAVGAESLTEPLDIDFSQLRSQTKSKYIDLDLFGGLLNGQ